MEAAALLVGILDGLGVRGTARPVAFLAYFRDAGGNPVSVATSRQVALEAVDAGEISPPDEVTERDDLDLGWGGHVVVVTEHPATLLDPTFGQFSYAGLRPVSLKIGLSDTVPLAGKWEVRSTEVVLRWVPGDWYAGGEETFVSLLEEWRPLASKIASAIKAGRSSREIPLAPSWATIRAVRDLD